MTKTPLSILFLPIGLPGSGKTQLRKEFIKYYEPFHVISPDDIRFKYLNSEETKIYYEELTEPQIWKEVDRQYLKALNTGHPIFFDATNLYHYRRERFIDTAKENGYLIAFYWIQIPFWLTDMRNNNRERKVPLEVMKRMRRSFDKPTEDEYDFLTIIKKRPSFKELFKYIVSKHF